MQQVVLPGKVLGQGDSTCFWFCTGEDTSERDQELSKLPNTQQLPSGLNRVGSLGSHKQDGLVSAHPGRENQVTSEQHTYVMRNLKKHTKEIFYKHKLRFKQFYITGVPNLFFQDQHGSGQPVSLLGQQMT